MDTVDAATRSRIMSRIRGRDTRPELAVRRYLHAVGLRFRLGGCGLPGRPDIVFAARGAVIFVHGCFWHRHPGCRFATTPSTRAAFWRRKFEENVARDARAESRLADMGWTCITCWECQTRNDTLLDEIAWRVFAASGLGRRR
jgi:DNA mismatch endonuclease (patch repair protein)